MLKSDFYYNLPEELIAQEPIEPRDASRLLVMDKQSGALTDGTFRDIKSLLRPGDCLILNDSRVLPARLLGERMGTGAHVELLLLTPHGNDVWEVLAGPGRRAKPGNVIAFGGGILKAKILEVLEGGNRLVKFEYEGNFYETLDRVGQMPLPPYIKKRLEDGERYQTVYSRELGSAAAPTAGLHFTPELLEKIRQKGVAIAPVMLHVGLGTFRPVKVESINDHIMHTEFFSVPEESARLINERKARGGRLICVGTTSCRTIESVAEENGQIPAMSGDTGIFIYPGYQFKAVDALITNFHLPESTLLMLVSAFYNREKVMEAYRMAVEEEYRFFSFGDAMFLS